VHGRGRLPTPEYVRPSMGGSMVAMDVQDQTPKPQSDAVEEEWPPREWRETTRSAGHKQALYVTLAMLAMFGALVALAIWASHNG